MIRAVMRAIHRERASETVGTFHKSINTDLPQCAGRVLNSESEVLGDGDVTIIIAHGGGVHVALDIDVTVSRVPLGNGDLHVLVGQGLGLIVVPLTLRNIPRSLLVIGKEKSGLFTARARISSRADTACTVT